MKYFLNLLKITPVGKVSEAVFENFLDGTAWWYKLSIILFLILNPILMVLYGNMISGWFVIAQFIYMLAMSLKAYPLAPAGLLALEVVAMNMTSPDLVYEELVHNVPVLFLLIFMVSAVSFLTDLLSTVFSEIIVKVRGKIALKQVFMAIAAVTSAFLDALTVTSVIITVGLGLYLIYHRFASLRGAEDDHDPTNDDLVAEHNRNELEQFRSFMLSLLMHFLIGTMTGGLMTKYGEPQNMIIADEMGWSFQVFFLKMIVVSIPVFLAGFVTSVVLEKLHWFGYGEPLPQAVFEVISKDVSVQRAKRDLRGKLKLFVQAVAAGLLIVALSTHIAEVGVVGLALLVVLAAFNGEIDEHRITRAFHESMPFVTLLAVMFVFVSMIDHLALFDPVIEWALQFQGKSLLLAFFGSSGSLSLVSDNVFVGKVFMLEGVKAYNNGLITFQQLEHIAIAINAGTNVPSIGTPNGQAAFLFFITSALAPQLRMSYLKMVWMALPFTIILTSTAVLAIWYLV